MLHEKFLQNHFVPMSERFMFIFFSELFIETALVMFPHLAISNNSTISCWTKAKAEATEKEEDNILFIKSDCISVMIDHESMKKQVLRL